MKLFGLIFVIYSINAQSPFANTLDVSNAIRQFTNTFLIDLGKNHLISWISKQYSEPSLLFQNNPVPQILCSVPTPSTQYFLSSCLELKETPRHSYKYFWVWLQRTEPSTNTDPYQATSIVALHNFW